MAKITRSESAVNEKNLVFIGKAWEHETKSGKRKGEPYLSTSLDRGIDSLTIKQGETLLFFKNPKREGKDDADWRIAVKEAKE